MWNSSVIPKVLVNRRDGVVAVKVEVIVQRLDILQFCQTELLLLPYGNCCRCRRCNRHLG